MSHSVESFNNFVYALQITRFNSVINYRDVKLISVLRKKNKDK